MKTIILSISVLLGSLTATCQQTVQKGSDHFNIDKFQKELIRQMEISFPNMKLDTSIAYACRATSQKDAGYPICYGTKKGGMVDLRNDESKEAEKIVREYRQYLKDVLHFSDHNLDRSNFTEFCATATLQYGGLIRYGLIIDNNITREEILEEAQILVR